MKIEVNYSGNFYVEITLNFSASGVLSGLVLIFGVRFKNALHS